MKVEGRKDRNLILSDASQTLVGEIKDPDSKETLLRAIVEAETYCLKVSKNPTALSRFEKCYGHTEIKPAVLFFAGENSQPWKDYQTMKEVNMPFLKKMITDLKILLFLVEPEDEYDGKVPYGERKYRVVKLTY